MRTVAAPRESLTLTEAASIGLRLDRDDEIIRRAFQLGDDGRWHRSPTIDRFVEIAHVIDALRLMPVYTASSCRTVTVLAEHRDPNEEAAACARRHAERVRARWSSRVPNWTAFPPATTRTSRCPK
jgi:hypothetical protein